MRRPSQRSSSQDTCLHRIRTGNAVRNAHADPRAVAADCAVDARTRLVSIDHRARERIRRVARHRLPLLPVAGGAREHRRRREPRAGAAMAADVDVGRGARERAARLRVSAHGAARGRVARRAAGGAASVGERACAARAGRAEVPARQPPAAAHARRRADGAGGRRSGGGRAARAGTVVALRHRGDGRAEGYLGARLPAVHERHQVDELGARAGDARASGRGGGSGRRRRGGGGRRWRG
ncbi:Uncharacterised protein [Burkholderia pseudomallei]|nr:Uncharacterised protein [Burkholderia pseudomallei]